MFDRDTGPYLEQHLACSGCGAPPRENAKPVFYGGYRTLPQGSDATGYRLGKFRPTPQNARTPIRSHMFSLPGSEQGAVVEDARCAQVGSGSSGGIIDETQYIPLHINVNIQF